ncbi:ABC transporter permease [Planctomycetota bacterium]
MGSIWAVARNTVKQALRMRVAIVFIVMLMILLPTLGFSITGDQTLKGRLQTFVSYGLSLTGYLLCLLTIIISIYTVTNDIKERQIYTVITKPIRRHEFILGKLLGVILLDFALLVLFSVIIYAFTINIPRLYNATDDELIQVNNEFFTARKALTIPEIDVSQEVLERYEELKKKGMISSDYTSEEQEQIIAELTTQAQLEKRAANLGESLIWDFDNVKPRSETMFIRFKYGTAVEPGDNQVFGRWFAGDGRFVKYGEKPEKMILDSIFKHSIGTFHEIEFPSEVIPDNGRLTIAFQNPASYNETAVIFPPDGLEILYKTDTFTGNFIRSVLLIFCRLIFLACMGTLTATFVSFPVAMLMCLVMFFIATISGFIIESFNALGENLSILYSYTLKWVVRLLPQFDKYNPTDFLVQAKFLSWTVLAQCVVVMVCIKSFLLIALSFIIFSYREIAKIIV